MQVYTVFLCGLIGMFFGVGHAEPITITFNPTIYASPILSAQQTSVTQVDLSQAFLKTVCCKVKEYSQTIPLKIFEKTRTHWRFIIGASCIVTYAALIGFMVYVHKKLDAVQCWSCWNGAVPSAKLESYSVGQIEQELVLDIQKKYFNPKDPGNYLSPFILFWNDIEHEIWTLEWYLSLWNVCRHRPFLWILPINKAHKHDVKIALQRAYVVKKLFLAWIAERNTALQGLYIQKAL